jgi:hypothetical protein
MRAARANLAPLVLVGAAVLFGAWTLSAELIDVAYPNDASIHDSMVRWAADRIRDGRLPFDGWYPPLSLGASRFHHYQSLPHILTGGVSVLFGAGTFRWTLYLLLVTWPVAVYLGARLFELDRWSAAVAAAVAPLVASAAGLGFEWGSYVWRGSGVWAQLWGMWALPFAWALGWRAVSRRGGMAPAAVAIGLTTCFHLLTGYLALLALGVWVLIAPTAFGRRLLRAALVGLGSLAVAAWMLIPLVTDAGWTIHDEASTGTFYYDSFGAAKILGWLVRGQLFDARRMVGTISVLALLGLVAAIVRWRRDEASRALVGIGVLSLLLFFGRPTLGWAIDLLPGAQDLFLRRYLVGVHLAGILLAGLGTVWAARGLRDRLRAWLPELRPAIVVGVFAGVVALALAPAMFERAGFERTGARWIDEQRVADATDGAAFARLVGRAERSAPGRVFAGLRSRSGSIFRIGQVPAYIWLLRTDADGLGFTRPTWSLMSGAEARFDPARASHHELFGARYVIAPRDQEPVAATRRLATDGPFGLWEVDAAGPLRVVDTSTTITADRDDLTTATSAFLRSDLPDLGRYPTVAFGGRPAAPPTLADGQEPEGPAGEVLETEADAADGRYAGRVRADRPAVVALAASFDPRWTATVDGRSVPVQMLAPALVGVPVPAGEHDVAFAYRPISPWAYALWLAIGVAAVWSLALLDRRWRPEPEPAHRDAPDPRPVAASGPQACLSEPETAR